MSQRHLYYCDRCNVQLDYKNTAWGGSSVNIAWPNGFFSVKPEVGELCKKCATKLANANFKGKLLKEVLEAIESGEPLPLP